MGLPWNSLKCGTSDFDFQNVRAFNLLPWQTWRLLDLVILFRRYQTSRTRLLVLAPVGNAFRCRVTEMLLKRTIWVSFFRATLAVAKLCSPGNDPRRQMIPLKNDMGLVCQAVQTTNSWHEILNKSINKWRSVIEEEEWNIICIYTGVALKQVMNTRSAKKLIEAWILQVPQ